MRRQGTEQPDSAPSTWSQRPGKKGRVEATVSRTVHATLNSQTLFSSYCLAASTIDPALASARFPQRKRLTESHVHPASPDMATRHGHCGAGSTERHAHQSTCNGIRPSVEFQTCPTQFFLRHTNSTADLDGPPALLKVSSADTKTTICRQRR